MKTGTAIEMAARALLAPMFVALMLAGGVAVAEELDDPILSQDDGDGLAALDSNALAETSGGFALQQISNVDQETTFTDNPITVDNGGQINTGGILAATANSGGITTNMLNTGNNVSFQNSTTLNVYLDAAH